MLALFLVSPYEHFSDLGLFIPFVLRYFCLPVATLIRPCLCLSLIFHVNRKLEKTIFLEAQVINLAKNEGVPEVCCRSRYF